MNTWSSISKERNAPGSPKAVKRFIIGIASNESPVKPDQKRHERIHAMLRDRDKKLETTTIC